jgi:hypothetical protein
MTPWQVRVYWKAATRIDVERIDVAEDARVSARHLAMIERNRPTIVTEAVVENHEAGLLFVEGRLVERLAPGRHAFWIAGRKIEVKRLDLRPQAVEITAQEMLTKDRIALRVTLTAFRRVIDPSGSSPRCPTWMRGCTVWCSSRSARRSPAARWMRCCRRRLRSTRSFGTMFARVSRTVVSKVTELGVKDVILPGEIRELVNKVVEADRVAKANLIRRQEETAATRSLLNTARLMEENPLLLRLKELESLERRRSAGSTFMRVTGRASMRCSPS